MFLVEVLLRRKERRVTMVVFVFEVFNFMLMSSYLIGALLSVS